MMKMMMTREDLFELSMSESILLLNAHQLRLLGVGYPPKLNWSDSVIGQEFPHYIYSLCLAIKGRSKKDRNAILRKCGINPCTLFTTPIGKMKL